MNLPDVPIPQEYVLNEYHDRLSNLTAANIRLTAMVHAVIDQRDAAIRRALELEAARSGRESAETQVIHNGIPSGV